MSDIKYCCYSNCGLNSSVPYCSFISFPRRCSGSFSRPVPCFCFQCLSRDVWLSRCGRTETDLAAAEASAYVCNRHFFNCQGPTEQHEDPIPHEIHYNSEEEDSDGSNDQETENRNGTELDQPQQVQSISTTNSVSPLIQTTKQINPKKRPAQPPENLNSSKLNTPSVEKEQQTNSSPKRQKTPDRHLKGRLCQNIAKAVQNLTFCSYSNCRNNSTNLLHKFVLFPKPCLPNPCWKTKRLEAIAKIGDMCKNCVRFVLYAGRCNKVHYIFRYRSSKNYFVCGEHFEGFYKENSLPVPHNRKDGEKTGSEKSTEKELLVELNEYYTAFLLHSSLASTSCIPKKFVSSGSGDTGSSSSSSNRNRSTSSSSSSSISSTSTSTSSVDSSTSTSTLFSTSSEVLTMPELSPKFSPKRTSAVAETQKNGIAIEDEMTNSSEISSPCRTSENEPGTQQFLLESDVNDGKSPSVQGRTSPEIEARRSPDRSKDVVNSQISENYTLETSEPEIDDESSTSNSSSYSSESGLSVTQLLWRNKLKIFENIMQQSANQKEPRAGVSSPLNSRSPKDISLVEVPNTGDASSGSSSVIGNRQLLQNILETKKAFVLSNPRIIELLAVLPKRSSGSASRDKGYELLCKTRSEVKKISELNTITKVFNLY